MPDIIIGIHGLANKPKRKILEDWWKKSIHEGLKKNCGIKKPAFNFKMVYWADLLYKNPQHNDEAFNFDKLYNNEPYRPARKGALKEYKDGWLDDVRAGGLNFGGVAVDFLKKEFGMDRFVDFVLGKVAKDLDFYYDKKRKIKGRDKKLTQAQTVLRAELRHVLIRHKSKRIMLIAHSMGTIIAYDVLREMGHAKNSTFVPDFELAHFMTIGSPLGLPHVKAKILKERKYAPVRTPSVVTGRWVNYADRKDPVALDVHLRDDYAKNAGNIRVEDDLVLNDYPKNAKGDINHHKSYGYLRTPEVSKHIRDFLAGK